MADPSKIVVALKATLNPKQQREAEAYLDEIKKIIAFCPTLLQIVMSSEVDVPIRQAAAVYLKNTVNRFWRERPPPEEPGEPLPFSLHEQDKARMRADLVQAMLACPEPLLQQLKVCLSVVAQNDFPGRWSEELPLQLAAALSTDTERQVPGALAALHGLLKVFQYAKPDRRAALEEAMVRLLPLLQRRLLLANNAMGGMDKWHLQRLALKAFNAYTNIHLPPQLEADRTLSLQWTEAVTAVLRPEQPPADCCQPGTESHPWWRAKILAAKCLLNWLERFGPADTLSKTDAGFGEWYVRSAAAPVLQAVLDWLERHGRGELSLPPCLLRQLLSYLQAGLPYAHLWRRLKPHLHPVLAGVCYPQLCFSDEDAELWEADPAEFVRLRQGPWADEFEEAPSAGRAAEDLVHEACAKRRNVLDYCVNFCTQAVNAAASAEPAGGEASARQRDGALRLLGCVADLLVRKPAYAPGIERFLAEQALPLAGSPRPYLRARACCLVRQFAAAEGTVLAPETVAAMAETVRLRLLDESELPVKMEAARALEALVDCHPAVADPVLRPHVPQLIGQLLDAMRRTVSDELNGILRKLFLHYSQHIGPLAISIVQQLADTLFKLLGDSDSAVDEDEEDKAVLAMGVFSTLVDVADAVQESDPRLMGQLEPLLLGLVSFVLDQGAVEYYEECSALAHRLVRRRGPKSPACWELLPMLIRCIERDGGQLLPDMVPVLHCLVTSEDGPGAGFLAGDRPIRLLDLCERVLAAARSGEEAEESAARLVEATLLQFPGILEPGFIQRALALSVGRMDRLQGLPPSDTSRALLSACLRVCLAALLHWPDLTLQLLPAERLLADCQRLHRWLDCLHDRRLCALALCQVMERRPDLPAQLLPLLLAVFNGLRASYQLKARLEAAEAAAAVGDASAATASTTTSSGDSSGREGERELDSDEDEANASRDEYARQLQGLNHDGDEELKDEEEANDDAESEEEEDLDDLEYLVRPPYETRLERPESAADAARLDEFLAVRRVLPACPQDALAALDPESAACLRMVLAEAEGRMIGSPAPVCG